MRILTLGAAVQDIFVSGAVLKSSAVDGRRLFTELELGSKQIVDAFHYTPGGGALNAAVGLARQGFEAVFCGGLGRDAAGLALHNALEAEEVDLSLTRFSDDYPTATSVILLDQRGERTILTHRGVTNYFDWLELERLPEQGADYCHITTLGNDFAELVELIPALNIAGTKIIWNPGVAELKNWSKLAELVANVEILIMNKEEAQQIAEGRTLPQLVRGLATLGATVTVVTDGRNGVLARSQKEEVRGLEYADSSVVDRTGAGDAFSVGFLAGYVRKNSLSEAVRLGSANGNSVVGYFGATTGLLYKGAKLHEMPLDVRAI